MPTPQDEIYVTCLLPIRYDHNQGLLVLLDIYAIPIYNCLAAFEISLQRGNH